MPGRARLAGKAIAGLVQLVAILALLVLGGAGTVRYPEGWAFLALFGGASLAITLYLLRADPELLARRVRAGPAAEPQRRQQIIQAAAGLAFVATILVPALDRRFGWSHAPLAAVIAGDVLVAAGFAAIFFVFRANTFTSAVIEVAPEQRVITTGPYAIVRHPMYAGALVLLAGTPLALGSLVGLVAFVPLAAVIVWRLLDEERYLDAHLPGYAAYRATTRHRLIPGVW